VGDLPAAAKACERALAANPLLPGARYLLGLVEQRRGDAVAAERELRKTVYIDPDFALAHLNLGTLYRGQERWDLACESFEAAVTAARGHPEGAWTEFLGGFDADTLVRTAERGLIECRKASGAA
jgi:chemotaxis protein methyltransferase CheR